ncbi:MAG TPA: hypothetical protein VJ487_10895 [Alphaproteobacteria bacterium]|nr:hypothetical protein [Alphaproteobacteria bacterium]
MAAQLFPVSEAWAKKAWWHELVAKASADCPAEVMDAEDPLSPCNGRTLRT